MSRAIHTSNTLTDEKKGVLKLLGMETAVRVNNYLYDRFIDENAVRVLMVLTGRCKAFGRLIDKIN